MAVTVFPVERVFLFAICFVKKLFRYVSVLLVLYRPRLNMVAHFATFLKNKLCVCMRHLDEEENCEDFRNEKLQKGEGFIQNEVS